MKKILLSITLVLIFCTQSLAESSVWKIQKDGSVMFLGGTIHLLRQSDFPLPVEFETAYQASDILVFETDIGKFQGTSAQQKLMAQAMYTDGSTIEQHLSARTYSILDEYCAASGIPLAKLKQFKPSIIAITLAAVELAKLGVGQEGVDTFFYQKATEDQKITAGLETIEEQINFIVKMGEGNEDAFIMHSLKDLESVKHEYKTMVDAWKGGEARKLNDLIITGIKTKMPQLYRKLLTDRNENWLPMIEAYHKTPRKEFILVGAAHLVGADGIIAALKQKGYKVEKL